MIIYLFMYYFLYHVHTYTKFLFYRVYNPFFSFSLFPFFLNSSFSLHKAMLFWTKLLTIAHATTTSVHPYLCLYYIHMLRFDILTVSLLKACVFILRVPASAFWIDLVDRRTPLHGVFTGLLTAIGTAGILMVLSVPPTWITIAALPVAIISSIFDGLFYQPLEVLIDSAIIKILGDYKILYGEHLS